MFKRNLAPLALCLLVFALPAGASWISPFISELHYDNAGTDSGESVAVTGPSGLDLGGWQVVLYNGADGEFYRVSTLSGVLADTPQGWAEVALAVPGIQNGPDAVALISPLDEVIDFVAYEASVTATDGAAAGLTATLLPVSEDSASPVGSSLQRFGTAADWAWRAATASPGAVNEGLVFATAAGVPVIDSLWLLFAGLGAWGLRRFNGIGWPGRLRLCPTMR